MWFVAIFQTDDGQMGYREFAADSAEWTSALNERFAIRPKNCRLLLIAEREGFDWQVCNYNRPCVNMKIRVR